MEVYLVRIGQLNRRTRRKLRRGQCSPEVNSQPKTKSPPRWGRASRCTSRIGVSVTSIMLRRTPWEVVRAGENLCSLELVEWGVQRDSVNRTKTKMQFRLRAL